MKIRLLVDLPIPNECGAFKGEVFETIEKVEPDLKFPLKRGTQGAWFIGRDGKECKAFFGEYERVKETSND